MFSNQRYNQKSKGELAKDLMDISADLRLKKMVTYIEDQVLDLLKLDKNQRKSLDRHFLTVGFDSLLFIELQVCLQDALGLLIPPESIEQESIEDLAEFLCNKVIPKDE